MSLEIVQRSILDLDVDAIVNPANSDLMHGGGLAAVIARAAGLGLAADCEQIVTVRRLPVGSAVSTRAGDLPFKAVIHAVGPRWGDQEPEESERLLTDAHASSLDVLADLGFNSVAFPAISCGIFRFPVELAAPIALRAVSDAAGHGTRVVFALPDTDVFEAFFKAASDLGLVIT